MSAAPLLQLRDLRVSFPGHAGELHAVGGVNLELAAGEFLGVVGESGSGKTQLLLAMLGLNGARGRLSGSIRFRDQELVGAGAAAWQRLRGARIGMIFQDPLSALNPYLTIGTQLTEGVRRHQHLGHRAATDRALALLEAVQLGDGAQRLRQYPHELSGGMRQRIGIAMALICQPDVLLADEPTTALDVTVQAQILALLRELRDRTGVALVLVTHDLGVIAETADRVCVMYAGRIVEQAPVAELFRASRHPYTEALRRSLLSLEEPLPERLPTIGGQPPDPAALPPGCAFAPRCRYVLARCRSETPELTPVNAGHTRACFYDGPLGRLGTDGT
jgi:oligopeptide/dipeptide ABC transporter ATP-binding protein